MKTGQEKDTPLPFRTLVIITLDCVRPDFLGCYGADLVRTPNIDLLASKGLVFEQAITQAPNTWVSHAGLFTGLYPPEHGLRSPYDRLHPDLPVLPTLLADYGFKSAAFPGNDLVGSRAGFQQGFDLFFEEYQMVVSPATNPETVNANNRNPWKDVLPAADRWLSQTNDPVFLWLHYLDTHHLPDCDIPEYFRFSRDPLWQFYEGKISYADERCVGAIISLLRRHGRYDDSLFVILSDHGETLLPGQPPFHNSDLDEAVLRVPLILSCEKIPWLGQRISQQVRTIDLVPTLLKLLELHASGEQKTSSESPESFSGHLLPLPHPDLKADINKTGREFAYAENESLGLACLRSPEWKFKASQTEEILFYLPADPQEKNNVIDLHPAIAEDLRSEMAKIRCASPRYGRLAADRDEQETQRVLRSLGYIE